VALLDIFLCSPTPEPPNDVDFSVVNDPNSPLKTLRERLMAHADNKVCASCHTRSDPVGLSLEGFRHNRRLPHHREPAYRSMFRASIQGRNFSGAQGLGQYIHEVRSTPPCVARRAVFLQPRRQKF
jgi:hypothetical protein